MKVHVNNGIDNITQVDKLLKGKHLGLITTPTGINRHFRSTIDILNENYNLLALFSPEHGVRGDIQAGEKVETYIDDITKLPVYSLYGNTKKVSQDMLKDIEVMVFDIQDVGVRHYTFLYTMTYAMESCKENGIKFVVLDRINPLGGHIVDGTMLDEKFSSFVGKYSVPTRYGLTIGEFANYINQKENIGCDLYVAKCSRWDRCLYFDETDLPWVLPSPNIPTIDTAILYTGTHLFEGTNVSEGRGTTKPFEFIGAPWINGEDLASIMNKKAMDGAYFRPVYFKPTFSKHSGNLCKGVQIHITDRNLIRPFEIGLHLLYEIKRLYKEFEWIKPSKQNEHYFIDLLAGSSDLRDPNFNVEDYIERNKEAVINFAKEKEQYHIYK